MRQGKVWRRTIRQHHLFYEGTNVDFVVGETAHVSLARIEQLPRRMPLSAPVNHRHRESPVAQVAYSLEVFFDLLAASGKHADGPLTPLRRRPAREAQLDPVGGSHDTANA